MSQTAGSSTTSMKRSGKLHWKLWQVWGFNCGWTYPLQLIWDEFAVQYVELASCFIAITKKRKSSHVLFSAILWTRSANLFLIMPVMTEGNLWTNLRKGSIVTNTVTEDLAVHTGRKVLKDLIRAVQRSTKQICILVRASDSDLEAFFNNNVNYIKRYKSEHLEIASNIPAPELAMSASSQNEIYCLSEPQCRRNWLAATELAKWRTGYGC